MERIARVGLSSEAILILMHVVIFSSDGLGRTHASGLKKIINAIFTAVFSILRILMYLGNIECLKKPTFIYLIFKHLLIETWLNFAQSWRTPSSWSRSSKTTSTYSTGNGRYSGPVFPYQYPSIGQFTTEETDEYHNLLIVFPENLQYHHFNVRI